MSKSSQLVDPSASLPLTKPKQLGQKSKVGNDDDDDDDVNGDSSSSSSSRDVLQSSIDSYFVHGHLIGQGNDSAAVGGKKIKNIEGEDEEEEEEVGTGVAKLMAKVNKFVRTLKEEGNNNKITSTNHQEASSSTNDDDDDDDTCNDDVFDALHKLFLQIEEENVAEFSELAWSQLNDKKIQEVMFFEFVNKKRKTEEEKKKKK
jgi:DNA-binding protein Fis